MYAIVQVGGRQYRAMPGDRLVVDRMEVEPGTELQLPDVRMLVAEAGDSEATEVGRPRLEEVYVAATAMSHFRGPKLLVFKYKPKKRYRRKRGFRAELTELRIDAISRGGVESSNEVSVPAAKPAAKPTRRRAAADVVPAPAAALPAPAAPVATASAGAAPVRARRAAKAPLSKPTDDLAAQSEESGDGA